MRVYRSPGLSPAEIAPVVDSCPRLRISRWAGELDLYAEGAGRAARQQHGYAPEVLAITGTNGKTTVTSLTGQLLEHART